MVVNLSGEVPAKGSDRISEAERSLIVQALVNTLFSQTPPTISETSISENRVSALVKYPEGQ